MKRDLNEKLDQIRGEILSFAVKKNKMIEHLERKLIVKYFLTSIGIM